VVERFGRIWPGETCAPQAPAQASLLETYWRPVEIDGKPVVVRPGAREPHFVLRREGDRVNGFGGCNAFTGSFEQGAGEFRFKMIASTQMACLHDSELETRFLSALHATASHWIVGEALELRDLEGKIRVRLEARYMK
jgi:heat shock protein HslJ